MKIFEQQFTILGHKARQDKEEVEEDEAPSFGLWKCGILIAALT